MTAYKGRTVALVGLAGAGKSSVALALAGGDDAQAMDLDRAIEAAEGRPIEAIFTERGEAYFRERESEWLERALARSVAWLSCGGGVVLAAANRRMLRERCDVVWLQVSPAEALRRLGRSGSGRPLLRGSADPGLRMAELLHAREPFYRELADLIVPTDGRSIEEVVADVRTWSRSGGRAAS